MTLWHRILKRFRRAWRADSKIVTADASATADGSLVKFVRTLKKPKILPWRADTIAVTSDMSAKTDGRTA